MSIREVSAQEMQGGNLNFIITLKLVEIRHLFVEEYLLLESAVTRGL